VEYTVGCYIRDNVRETGNYRVNEGIYICWCVLWWCHF